MKHLVVGVSVVLAVLAAPASAMAQDADSTVDDVREWVRENDPWSSVGIFTAAAFVAQRALGGAILPIAIGIAAVELARGGHSMRDIALTVGSFAAAAFAVNLLADAIIYPALFAAGPPGWAAAGLYFVGKAVATYFVGSKLRDWIGGLFGGGKKKGASAAPTSASGGLTQRLAAMGGVE